MDERRTRALKAAGWSVGSTEQFLGLTEEEIAFIEMKLALAEGIRDLRLRASMTQTQVAGLIGSSQSRVAEATRTPILKS